MQTAAPKLPAKQSYVKFSKATQIGHFRRFCKRGNKVKPPKKKADLRNLKNNLCKSHDISISMRLKDKHPRTFRRKGRLQNRPQSQVMVNLAKLPQLAIFADFAKGGPRENRPKKKADLEGLKSTLRKSHDTFNSKCLKCKHRTTFRRKRRLQNCPQNRLMTNSAPKSAIFENFAKRGPRENRLKRRPT